MRAGWCLLALLWLAACGGGEIPPAEVASRVSIIWQGDGTLICNGQSFSGGLEAADACVAALGPTDENTMISVRADGDVISGELMALLEKINESRPSNVTFSLAD